MLRKVIAVLAAFAQDADTAGIYLALGPADIRLIRCRHWGPSCLDGRRHSVAGGPYGIGREVGVAVGGLSLGMAEQLADHVQPFAEPCSDTGKAVTQVVDAHILEPRGSTDTAPGLLQVDEMRSWLRARQHPAGRIVRQGVEHGGRGTVQVTTFAPVFESGSRRQPRARSTCSQRRMRISDIRQPVNTSSRIAAIDDGHLVAVTLGLDQRRTQPRRLVR